MVLELIAGRLVSRHVGQSLYTWTSIIGVVLAGISLGNYVGGRLADRGCGRRTLAVQFILAGIGCFGVMAANRWVGGWPWLGTWPWPAHIVVHVAMTFFAPAAVLGTISPVITRRALNLGLAEGRTVGGLFAWSIAGSVSGTFLTGFFFLEWMGVSVLAVSTAGVLIAVGILYAIGSRYGEPAVVARATEENARDASAGAPFLGWLWLIATVFLVNACLMAMEVVAGRIVSFKFGQSLYTWTSVIGIVLVGMVVGSALGGRLADRFRLNGLIAALSACGALGCILISPLNTLLGMSLTLDALALPARILLHTTGLFLVPSVFLGAVTPVLVKKALQCGRPSGATVGTVYAWNALGSIAGTFLAGFFLIAAMGMFNVLYLTAAILTVLALAHARRSVLAYAWTGVCGLALVLVWAPWGPAASWGEGLLLRHVIASDVVYKKESQYSYIVIRRDPERPHLLQLCLDKLLHGHTDPNKPLCLEYEYARIYAAILDKYFPRGTPLNTLTIGGGGYVLPHYLELTRPESYNEVAEIDPAVTEAAHAAFGFPRETRVVTYAMDARNRVTDLVRLKHAGRSGRQLDCFFGDTFNNFSVPYHLTTEEFTRQVYETLNDNGMYFLNSIDRFDSGRFLGALIATCLRVFPHVYVFDTGVPTNARDTFVLICSKRPLDLTDIPDTIRQTYKYPGRLLDSAAVESLLAKAGGVVLTDDYAPVENLLSVIARERQSDPALIAVARAKRLINRGKLDEAVELLRKAITENPESPTPYEELSAVFAQRGDLDDALDILRKTPSLDFTYTNAHYSLGLAFAQKGDFEHAIEVWRNTLSTAPNYDDAHFNLVLAFTKLKRYDEAWAQVKAWRSAGGTVDPGLLQALKQESGRNE